MIEKYIEITCDRCGEIEWSASNETMREFKSGSIGRWKHRGRLSLCPACVAAGHRWSSATLHTSHGAKP